MAGAASALLRSVSRRSKAAILVSARSLPRPLLQPEAASAVLSPKLLFHGGLLRRRDLPPVATLARLSSCNPGCSNKNPSPLCTEPTTGLEDKNKELPESSRKKLPVWDLQKQIIYKQGELLQLLLQLHGEPSHDFSDTEKCLQQKEQLLHLLREFQASTQCKETQQLDSYVSFLRQRYIHGFSCIVCLVSDHSSPRLSNGTRDGTHIVIPEL